MSITDELREWINGNTIIHVTELRAIADRIDAEHEEKVSYWQGACYEDGYKEGLKDNEDAMAEHGLLERMELLTTSLRNDYGIDASWDGLRRLWTIELTEDGCLMRDRACKAEAENAKLRELVRDMWHEGAFAPGACYVETDRLEERTRELGIEV